jgi:bifunctional non-homologous end joining protein LigD
VIEEGGYGAGPVLLWDDGWYEPALGPGGTVEARLASGKLDFTLHGRRLKGGFSLVRMQGRPGQWLLIKGRGAAASSPPRVSRAAGGGGPRP